MQSFQGGLYIGQGVVVSDCVLVQLSVVHDDSLLRTVFLVDEVDWCCVG
jgi:hypothetical protein